MSMRGSSPVTADTDGAAIRPHAVDPHVRSVLLHRPASIGDTVVVLPTLRLIAAAFPNARRYVLTITPRQGEQPMSAVLGAIPGPDGQPLVTDYISYAGSLSLSRHDDRTALTELASRLNRLQPDRVVYLIENFYGRRALRDCLFLRLTTGRSVIGTPGWADLRNPRPQPGETEAERLLRSVSSLGTVDLSDPAAWDLQLTAAECAEADRLTAPLAPHPYIIVAPGAKIPSKDWGAAPWQAFLTGAEGALREPTGVLLLGGPDDSDRLSALAPHWSGGGPVVVSADAPVRIAAAACRRARTYVGHDSGLMHLAAAVGCPTVSLFSGRFETDQWRPFGPPETVTTLYQSVPCAPCWQYDCSVQGHPCMARHNPADVWTHVQRVARP